MAVTPTSFRRDFPEFASGEDYPDNQLAFWLSVAGKMLSASRWSTLLDLGLALFTAHNIVLERKAAADAANGVPPGMASGPVSSKSVDKVSVSYDVNAAMEPDAGHWNLTIYGTRFIKLSRMFGAGPVQIGAGQDFYPDALSTVNAWAGPWPWNIPSQNN